MIISQISNHLYFFATLPLSIRFLFILFISPITIYFIGIVFDKIMTYIFKKEIIKNQKILYSLKFLYIIILFFIEKICLFPIYLFFSMPIFSISEHLILIPTLSSFDIFTFTFELHLKKEGGLNLFYCKNKTRKLHAEVMGYLTKERKTIHKMLFYFFLKNINFRTHAKLVNATVLKELGYTVSSKKHLSFLRKFDTKLYTFHTKPFKEGGIKLIIEDRYFKRYFLDDIDLIDFKISIKKALKINKINA